MKENKVYVMYCNIVIWYNILKSTNDGGIIIITVLLNLKTRRRLGKYDGWNIGNGDPMHEKN